MNRHNPSKQQGVALIISLVILIGMTVLGVTSMKTSITNVFMAGNLRETGITFQAAEAGLRLAEEIVSETTSSAEFDGLSPSKLGETDPDPRYMDPTSWVATESSVITLAGVSTSPKFIIKYLGKWSQNPGALVNLGQGYGGQPPGRIISNYRVTSRGSGQTERSFRTVQSYYGIEY